MNGSVRMLLSLDSTSVKFTGAKKNAPQFVTVIKTLEIGF